MIMRQNYFLDLLAVDSPSTSSSGNTSSTPVLRTLPGSLSTVQIFSHSSAEVHRRSAHRAQASWRPRVKSSGFGDNPNQSLTISINLVRGAYVMGVT